GLLRMTNNNIIHHIGFYGLTLVSDNYTELHITSIIRRLNSNDTDGITTCIRLEDARRAEASRISLITLPNNCNLSKQNLLHNLALFERVLCDTKGIKLHNDSIIDHGTSQHNAANKIIYDHLSALPKSPT